MMTFFFFTAFFLKKIEIFFPAWHRLSSSIAKALSLSVNCNKHSMLL